MNENKPRKAKRTPEEKRAYYSAYYQANRVRRAAEARAWNAANKTQRAATARRWRQRIGRNYSRDCNLRAKYGVSLAEYERMVETRGGLCDICKQPPRGKRHHSVLHIDHCHETGRNRGLLCGPCNTALGLLREDAALLAAAIAYLRRHAPEAAGAQEGAQDADARTPRRPGTAQRDA